MKEIILQDRFCDCCNSKDLEELWSYKKIAKTKNNVFLWNVKNVICKNCGFVFVSPAPSQESLLDYYKDSFEVFSGQTPDFSVKKRISVIKNLAKKNNASTYAEIGSNNIKPFIDDINKLKLKHTFIELNESCHKDQTSIDSIKDKNIDIISAYFVLEHIPQTRDFFEKIYDALSKSGFLIIEVPDLNAYTKNQTPLSLWEHTNHFTPRTLTKIAKKHGFKLIKISSKECSRTYGFLAVFQKTSTQIHSQTDIYPDITEYEISKTIFYEALNSFKKNQQKIKNTQQKILKSASQNKQVIIWGANATCIDLLTDFTPPQNTIIIDSNPQKKDYLDFMNLKVFLPENARQAIDNSKIIIINSKFRKNEILNYIQKKFNKTFKSSEIITL